MSAKYLTFKANMFNQFLEQKRQGGIYNPNPVQYVSSKDNSGKYSKSHVFEVILIGMSFLQREKLESTAETTVVNTSMSITPMNI